VTHRKRVISALVAFALAAGVVAASALANSRTLSLAHPLPSLVRQKDRLTVRGTITGVPGRTAVVLEFKRIDGHWLLAAKTDSGYGGAFTIRWRVPASEDPGPVTLRVAALRRNGALLARTKPTQSAIGPAAVYCAPPAPPMIDIPEGSGWVAGGVYTQGGPYPGVYECDSQQYTITATSTGGKVAASQTFPGGQSYTLVLPAGSYTLSAGACRGTATIAAAKQTTANTYCDVP
jgi:hypothetical protein